MLNNNLLSHIFYNNNYTLKIPSVYMGWQINASHIETLKIQLIIIFPLILISVLAFIILSRLEINLFICMSFYVGLYVYVCMSFLYVLSVCLCVCLYVCMYLLSVCLSVCWYIYVYLTVCVSVCI